MRKNSSQLIILVIIAHFSFVSVLGTPHQDHLYYFNISCTAQGKGSYGELWDFTLIVECSCIESSYLYEDITVNILLYETYQGNEELTKTVSFFFGDMKSEESKTLSKTVKTKYPISSPTARDNLRIDISNDVTFTKRPLDDPAFPWWALLLFIVVGGGVSIIGFLFYRSRRKAESIYTLGTSPKPPFISSHKAPPASSTDNITSLHRADTSVCSKCGAIIQEAQKFCSHCGEIKE